MTTSESNSPVERLGSLLLDGTHRMYGLFDIAGAPDLLEALGRLKTPVYSVPFGHQPAKLAGALPILAALPMRREQWYPLLQSAWGRNSLILISSDLNPDKLASRLVSIQQARRPDGRVILLRIADPRTLSVILDSATSAQADILFRDIRFYAFEADKGTHLVLVDNDYTKSPRAEPRRRELALQA